MINILSARHDDMKWILWTFYCCQTFSQLLSLSQVFLADVKIDQSCIIRGALLLNCADVTMTVKVNLVQLCQLKSKHKVRTENTNTVLGRRDVNSFQAIRVFVEIYACKNHALFCIEKFKKKWKSLKMRRKVKKWIQ